MGIFDSLFKSKNDKPKQKCGFDSLVKDLSDVDKLIQKLKDEDGHVRLDAVRELGKTKDSHAVEPLIIALSDREDYVRWNAAESLGFIKDTRSIDSLIKALNDKHPLVKQDALAALRQFSDERAIKAVAKYEEEYKERGVTKEFANIQQQDTVDPTEPSLEQLRQKGGNAVVNIDTNDPKCSSCGKALGSKGSIFDGARVVTTGSQTVEDLEDDYTLFRGSVCFSCKAVFCMECNRGMTHTCPKCQRRDTEPAYRKHLRKLSRLCQ